MAHFSEVRRVSGFDGAVSSLRTRVAKYRTYRRTLNELSALSPRDLDDLGVHPSQLNRIAWTAAYGK